MSDPVGDSLDTMRDTAIASFVSVLMSLFGLNKIGFPLDNIIYAVFYVASAVVIAVLATAAAAAIATLFILTKTMKKIVETAAAAMISAAIILGIGAVVGAPITAASTNPVPAPPVLADSPGTSTTVFKASQPANTDLCASGSGEIFSSVAADLGPKGMGESGAKYAITYTSCPFAMNVRAEYLERYPVGSSGGVSATSPKSPNLGYIAMHCWAPSNNMIQCDGGNGARVYIY